MTVATAVLLAALTWAPGIVSQTPVAEIYGDGVNAVGCGPDIAGCSPYEITSTANSGAGTVRDFFSTGNRYVSACTVSGTVTLTANLDVSVSNWTLDLGKCPDMGLQLTGRRIRLGINDVSADHWIIRNLRSRSGEDIVTSSCEVSNASNWAITNSSCQLGGDDSLDIGAQGNNRYVDSGTVQYTLIGPTLGCDNVALGCNQVALAPHNEPSLIVGNVGKITYFRNMLMGGDDGRCPRFAPGGIAQSLPPETQTPSSGTGRLLMVENWIIGCKWASLSWPDQDWLMKIDYLRNYVQESTTQVTAGEALVERPFDLVENNMESGGTVQIHAEGNMIHSAGAPPADPCDLLSWDGGTESGAGGPLCEDRPQYDAASRVTPHALSSIGALLVPEIVAARAGALRPCRDPFDETVVASAVAGTGIWIEEGLAEVGGLPDLTDPCE